MSNGILMRPLPFTVYSAANIVAGSSKDYMANDHMGVVSRMQHASSSSQPFILDLGADMDFDTIALIGLTDALSSWTMQVSVADQATGPGFAGGHHNYTTTLLLAGTASPTSGRGRAYWEKPAGGPALVRYIRILITTHAVGTAITVARAVVGKRFQPARNFSFGAAFGVRDHGEVKWSARAVLLRRKSSKLRSVGLSFSALYKDEVEASVQELIERVGNTEPILLVTDPAAHAQRQRRIYFGPLIGNVGTIWAKANAGFQFQADLVDLESY